MPASPEPKARVLILGGTAEARALAAALDENPDIEAWSSLAGATRRPAPLAGRVRSGGFGGADGLARFLAEHGIARAVDATHPFAQRISAHAAEACRRAGVPLLRLARPPWARRAGDRWVEVPDAAAAAAALPGLGRRVFLSLGRKELAAFAGFQGTWFLVRLIEPPERPPPLEAYELILARGPFALAEERALLGEHAIEVVVSKNSGGPATYAKIAAARELGLPVLMLTPPPAPAGVTSVSDVEAALAWLAARPGGV